MGGADIAYMAGTSSPVYASRAQSVIPGTSFGNPDYRCSTVEISTSAPWSSHSGQYYPRLVHPEMRQVADNPAVYVGGRMHHPSLRFRLHSILKNKI